MRDRLVWIEQWSLTASHHRQMLERNATGIIVLASPAKRNEATVVRTA